ncbi:MAG: isocitrate lyase/phosphoenolpyruvate mutase family protein [Spirochaetales bacterium]|nr:isocitrate lyase/phosphoenolpyruvate mutase family protein [Spirochaetales bacterium]
MTFREMHQPGNPFILANAWDSGSAKILAASGAKAIGSTSAGFAMTLGVKDMGQIIREQTLNYAQQLVNATSLPVSGDLENGYGHCPSDVAETILFSSKFGLAGASIEDTQLPSLEPYPFTLAVERIEAAVDSIHHLNQDFVLTARADGIMNQKYDCDEAIRRLQAFAAVGADVVYAPCPPSLDELARICREVDAPVNALISEDFIQYSIDDFSQIGVARISLGSSLARATYTTILKRIQEIYSKGNFGCLQDTMSYTEIEKMFQQIEGSDKRTL